MAGDSPGRSTRPCAAGRTDPAGIDYLNANGTGTSYADCAEGRGPAAGAGPHLAATPVSSTKSVHGHALEASALLEFVLTVLVLRAGLLPSTRATWGRILVAGLDLVLGSARKVPAGAGTH